MTPPVSTPDPVRPHECGHCGATYRRVRLAIDCCRERFEDPTDTQAGR